MNILYFCNNSLDSEIQCSRFKKITKHNVKIASYNFSNFFKNDINLYYFSKNNISILVDYIKNNNIDLIISDAESVSKKLQDKIKIPIWVYAKHSTDLFHISKMFNKADKLLTYSLFVDTDKAYRMKNYTYIRPYFANSFSSAKNEFAFYLLNNNKQKINFVKHLNISNVFSLYHEDLQNLSIKKIDSDDYISSITDSIYNIVEQNFTFYIDCFYNKKFIYYLPGYIKDMYVYTNFITRSKIGKVLSDRVDFTESTINFIDFGCHNQLHEILGE
ncbi:MAG: hypothetical protein LC122_13395 [Chitinophagales bacterium]|nr:hypothetical protein [Chitinophagales bacterium]